METIVALVLRTRHTSKDGNWRVCELRPQELTNLFGSSAFVAAGKIPDVARGDKLELQGEWTNTEKFGQQFNVSDAALLFPDDINSLERFLIKKVNGIGAKLAAKLREHFGLEVRQILDHAPSRLGEVGCTPDQILRIEVSWNENKHLQPIEIFLAGHNLAIGWAEKMYAKWGMNSVDVVRRNPYAVIDLPGLSFLKADQEWAPKLGWPPVSPERTEAAFRHVLQEGKGNGHMFLHRHDLVKAVAELAGSHLTAGEESDGVLDTHLVEEALQNVIERGEVVEETGVLDGQPVVMEYLPWLHRAELDLAERITQLIEQPSKPASGLTKLIAEAEEALEIKLSDQQQRAVIAALRNPFSVITGGPGTGKSTITKVILFCMRKLNWTVQMAAPTGRAAQRIAEITLGEASTIHRLLGYEKAGEWSFNRENPLTCDALFLDEWSMGDTDLTRRVMDAVPDGCHVVVIGDVDQLPSVGPGMVLRSLIDCGRVHVTRLDTIFRQAQGSLIVQNAHRIIRGDYPQFPKDGEGDHFVMHVPRGVVMEKGEAKTSDDINWLYTRLSELMQRIAVRYNVNPKTGVQVISPMKRGSAGTGELNNVLQRILNPDGERFDVKGYEYRLGDRVMQTKNNYTLGVFNGDIGIIKSYDAEKQSAVVDFGRNQLKTYPYETMVQLQLAFASTVHKLQGSECPVVIFVLLNQHWTMLDRNLVYTALTRAKQMCLFLTTKKALSIAVKRCQIHKRNSFLSERLRQARVLDEPELELLQLPLSA